MLLALELALRQPRRQILEGSRVLLCVVEDDKPFHGDTLGLVSLAYDFP